MYGCSDEEYLVLKTDKQSDDKCWNWTGSLNTGGYGYRRKSRGTILAHRISYTVHKGEIPSGMCVCHSCDNRKCVNPNHLFLGTSLDNTKDMFKKNRQHMRYGENSGSSKLTEIDVLVIRELLQQGHKNKDIAERFNVSRHLISMIKHRKRWSYL